MTSDPGVVLYPVIFQDHDGTWTWSIESGEAFEADHIVHARAEGCITKGDARKFMLEKMAELKGQVKSAGANARPAADGASATSAKAKKPVATGGKKNKAAADALTQPEWAVQADGRIEAIFRDPALAKAFGQERFGGKARVVRIRYGILPGE